MKPCAEPLLARWQARVAAAAMGLLLAGAALPAVPPLVQGDQLGRDWRVLLLPNQLPPATRFTPEPVQGREALRVEAERSYGNLVHTLPPGPPPVFVSWAWRVQQPGTPGDLRSKAGDDAPAKVCLTFDLPLQQVPFIERQLLRLARARSSQALPAATLCWVWAAGSVGAGVVENAYTRRVRYIVLRDATAPLGTWLDERRDLAADFQLAFGDESPELPPLTALIVGGDADNTGGHSVAHVAGLRLEP